MLSVSQVRLMSLTAQKSTCEYRLGLDTKQKMALTQKQSDLSKEYYSRLQSKDVTYYANGEYKQIDYSYLMGFGSGTYYTMDQNPSLLKKDNSMVLTDSNGLVVMDDNYAKVLKKVLGNSCIDADGRGGTFSISKIPELIAEIAGAPCTVENVQKVIDGGNLDYEYTTTVNKTKSQETVETGKVHVASDTYTSQIEQIVNFFYPIFKAASSNGWTTEYNKEMKANSDYLNSALTSGIFQLEQIDDTGAYKPDASLSYFITRGLVFEKTSSTKREEVTAWHDAEREEVARKESLLDIDIQELSARLEAINTEIDSVKSLIDKSMSDFEWAKS